MNPIQPRRSVFFRPADRAARFRPYAPTVRLTRGLGIMLALSGTATIAVSADPLQGAQKIAQETVQDPSSSAPLPPERPVTLAPTQAPPAHIAPQPDNARVNTVPPQAPQKEPDEPIDNTRFNEGPGTMLKLPPASHARMHQCAVEWQNMKLAGTAAEKIWFNFARECLTR